MPSPPPMLFRLADLLKSPREEGEIRCRVLRGGGRKGFLLLLRHPQYPGQHNPGDGRRLQGQEPPGGECDLAAACDMRIASENARLSLRGMKTIFRRIAASRRLSPQDAEEIEALRIQDFNSEALKGCQQAFR